MHRHDTFFESSLLQRIQKPVARLLIATMLFLDVPPFLVGQQVAQAAALSTDPNVWVTVNPKADPIMQNLNIPANAATQGMWSAPFAWPMNGLHNMILPDGKVLTFGTNANGDAQNGRTFDVWDPYLGIGANSHNTSFQAEQQDSFCSTATYLNDGNMLITGGNAGNGGYGKGSVIYNPVNNSRATAQAVTALPRWYSTMIGLPDGRKLVMGGMVPYTEGMYQDPEGAISRGEPSMTPEIYENGAWRSLFGANSRLAFGPDYLRTSFPHAFVAPNGLVFGVSADRMWYLDANANNGNGAVYDYGQFKPGQGFNADPDNVGALGVAVMYDIGKIIIAGGNGGFNGDGMPASNKVTSIDINNGAPVLTELPRMNNPRRYGNGIVLANGEVVITGGTRQGNDAGGKEVYAAEIWSPNTNTWSIGASASTIRVYHSISSLLLNGAIISTGGGTPGPVLNKTGEVYYPPYLFEQVGGASRLAARPAIKGISGLKYAHGASMQLDMDSNAAINSLVLIGLSNGTHSFNNGQRRIPLTFSQEENRLTTAIPNANLTPPGYYQVVALNAQGVPSYANVIAVGAQMAAPQVTTTPYNPGTVTPPPANVPPAVALTSPVAGTTYTQGATVAMTATADDSDGSVAFVDFYDGGTLLGSDITAPYAFNWVTSAATATGSHSITAVATDNAGAKTTSAVRSITVNAPSGEINAVNIAPSAVLATSYVSPWETLSAVNNNTSHTSSADKNGGAYGNWNGEADFGKTNWVSFSWPAARTLNAFEVYWWNDGLGIATPNEANVEYWNGNAWMPLGPIGLALNQYNRIDFAAISTTSIRVLMKSALSTGILEARVWETTVVNPPANVTKPTASTPITFESRTGANNRVWVVNPDNDSVSVIDATTNALIQSIPVGIAPRTIAIAPNGNIWVTNKDSATISVISPTTLAVVQTIALPRASQPFGLAFAPNGNSAFVVLEALGQLRKLDPANGALQGTLAVGSNPRHVSVTADSATALVSRFITPALPGEGTANVDTTTAGAEVVAVNAGNMTLNKTIVLKHSDKADTTITGSGIPNYLGATAISPDGKTAWVPSKQDNIKRGIARNGQPLNFQNTVRAISSRIDMATLTENLAARIDHDNSSVGSAAIYHPSGNHLFVALETSREVAVIDPATGVERFRISVGFAPQGLALSADGNTLYVQEFMDRSVSVVDLTAMISTGALNAPITKVVFTVPLDQEKLPANVLLGKQLFYDAKDRRLSLDSYMSCASCHNDGGHDGRVWDLTGFGEGLRNTINLKGRAAMGHGNLHWSANFDELQDFEGQIRALAGGTGLMTDAQFNTGTRNQPLGDKKAGVSEDLDNLAAYVTSLNTFAQSPNRNADGTLTAAATAGKTVFANSCASCHGGANFTTSTDGTNLKNIGTINPLSGQRLGGALTGIDVPTLRDVWATAPYLHNGSAATVTAAVQAHNNLTLTATELANVVAFVQQIGSEEAAVFPSNPTGDTDGDGIVDALDLYPNDATRGAGIWREQYNAIGGGDFVADLTVAAKFPNAPDVVEQVAIFAGPTNIGDSYGSRIRGIFTAPETGAYTFWVAGDNEVRLYLSTDNTAANKRQIAYVPVWTDANQWTKFPEQKSAVINLVAGQNYYLEVLHKEGFGGDNLSVAWQTPSNPTRTIMTDQYFQKAGGVVTPPTNTPPANAVNCAVENSTCTLPTGVSATVWYGANNNWNTKTGVTGSIGCTNAVFGDPIPGTVKSCRYVSSGTLPANIPPTVSITAPTSGTAITQGATVAITATAADSDGTVERVEFYDGATLLGTDTTSPYVFSWVTSAATATGAHSITARAYDNTGAVTTSAVVSVTVNAVSQNLAPSATLATSYVSPWETLTAVNNNTSHTSSGDKNGGAYGNWRGSAGYGQTDWVSFSWSAARTLNAFEVYWWNDGLGIATPTEARVEYWNGSAWVPLGNIGVALNQYNRLAFSPISTTSIRVLMSSNLSTGILEARVWGN